MPSAPIGLLVVEQLLRDLETMSTGNGYFYDYPRPEQGVKQWYPAEGTVSAPLVWVEPQQADPGFTSDRRQRGGERAGGAAFRVEDRVHILVHITTHAERRDLLRHLYQVRADLHRGLLTNRKRTGEDGLPAAGRPMTFGEQAEFLYPNLSPDQYGASVHIVGTLRWDHSTYDQSQG